MTGRYLYCLVDASEGPDSFGPDGVDGEATRLVTRDGIGAVVHDCEGLYDSDDPTEIRSWLLEHQAVVDAATEAFGTPLPVRFDTVIEGDDDLVRSWIDAAPEVGAHLDRLAGHREYHVTLLWDPEGFEAEARASDDRLAEIAAAVEESEGGTGFLREKQYDDRLREVRAERESTLADALVERIEDVVVEMTDASGGGASGAGSALDGETAEDDLVEVTRLAVLAHQSREGDLGERLDEVVEAYDVEIRFTGPWPPYSFAPTLSHDP